MHTISEDDLIYLYESEMISWADYCELITQIAQREDALCEMVKINQESGQYKKEMLDSMESCINGDNPLNKQYGGDHYKNKAIQPIEYILANDLNFCEGCIIKYATRWRDKGGVEDLKKIIHYAEFLISHEKAP